MAKQRLSKTASQSVSNFVILNPLSYSSSHVLVHGENESKFITILRTFDLSCEYGPCVGVSRLERWERANAMGLEPPQEVKPFQFARRNCLITSSLHRYMTS